MLESITAESYEISYLIEDGIVFVDPEQPYREHLSLVSEAWGGWRRTLFLEELSYLVTLLPRGRDSFFWIAEYKGVFWRIELSRSTAKRLRLRIFPIRQDKELCDILVRNTVPPDIYSNPRQMERVLLGLDRHGGYQIVSIGKRLSEAAGVQDGGSFESALSCSLYHQSNALLDLCLRTGRTLRTADIVSSDGERYHILITALPVNHKKRHVLLSLYFVEPEVYYQLHLRGNSITVPEKTDSGPGIAFYVGTAALQIVGAQTPDFCNAAFEQMLPAQLRTEFFAALNARLEPLPGSEARFRYYFGSLACYCVASRTAEGFFLVLWGELPEKAEITGEQLTRREIEIARHLCSGSPLRYIASTCGISEGTVKKTASNIYRKLGVSGRVELMRLLFH